MISASSDERSFRDLCPDCELQELRLVERALVPIAPESASSRYGTKSAPFERMSQPSAATLNRITSTILGCAIGIHQSFGSGLLESAYAACLAHDLVHAGFHVERQKALPLTHHGLTIACAYRADIVVDGLVLIEVKAVETLSPVCHRQVRTYLQLGDYRVGLLLNFGAPTMKGNRPNRERFS
jgi:iron complex transport system substrate-binding protein